MRGFLSLESRKCPVHNREMHLHYRPNEKEGFQTLAQKFLQAVWLRGIVYKSTRTCKKTECQYCYLFIVLPYEGLWSNFNLGDIGVLVQDMNVVIWWDAVDALALLRCGSSFTTHSISLALSKQ